MEIAESAANMTPQVVPRQALVLKIIGAVAFAHMINDLIQATLPAIYPILKENYHLNFTQIGLISLTYQITASLLQPGVGLYTDKYPKPFLLPLGMLCTLIGIICISFSTSFSMLLLRSGLIGIGSSTFHPEASRVARMASGGRFGLAQSTFQVGGNFGTAIGPLLAAVIIIPFGQTYFLWFILFALLGIYVLSRVSRWYMANLDVLKIKRKVGMRAPLSQAKVRMSFVVLAILVFSKYFYIASFTNYYTFYLIEKFEVSISQSQMYLFLFLGAIAAGTFFGGPIGDKIGRKTVIWVSILGVAPFALLLPYATLEWTAALTLLIGFVMSSAFSAIVVYAQELTPNNVGLVAGIFFGLMFGVSGVGAALLGHFADTHGLDYVYQFCAYLPLIGILAMFLPAMEKE